MNGHVIPDTPIAVDCWKLRNISSARIFFLTHYHADHMVGLSSNWPYPIYCSPVTGLLLKNHMKIKQHLIQTLEVDEAHVIDIADGEETITVSVFDANHCPGSVMYLFEGYFGKILYTGDFRYSESTFMESDMWQTCLEADILYLDNTYCDPNCSFPSREKTKQQIYQLIDSHKDFDIVFAMHAFGKEDLLSDIAFRYNTVIAVGKPYLEKVQIINLSDVFTDKPSETNMKVVNLHSVSTHLVKQWNRIWPTLVITVTALYTGLPENPYDNMPNVFTIPYSNHSSYSELIQFVKLTKPKKIKPVVTSNRGPMGFNICNRISVLPFDKYLSQEPQTSYNIPYSVKCMINTNMLERTAKRTMLKEKIKRRKPIFVPQGVVFDPSPEKITAASTCSARSHIEHGPHEKTSGKPEILSATHCLQSANAVVPDQCYISGTTQSGEPICQIPSTESCTTSPDVSLIDTACNASSSMQLELNSSVNKSFQVLTQTSLEDSNDISASVNGFNIVHNVHPHKEFSSGFILFENLVKNVNMVNELSNVNNSASVKTPELVSTTQNKIKFRIKKQRSKKERRKTFYNILNKQS